MGVTVSDVRKAITGLPDSAPILTVETFDDGAADVILDLISIVRDGGIVRMEIVVSDPEADLDADLDDEMPCPWCGGDPCDETPCPWCGGDPCDETPCPWCGGDPCHCDDRDSYREDP